MKLVALCPGNVVSGGPELLHQLVDFLQANGVDARICYYPFDERYACPRAYAHYNCPSTTFCDSNDTLFVLPESATRIIRDIRRAQIAIWWLSVDNYLGARHESFLADLIFRIKSLRRYRLPLFRLRKYRHFCQSIYALNFLARNGISAIELTDYLSASHLVDKKEGAERDDIVIFNPSKGKVRTQRLVSENPDIRFVPIQNMNSDQVAALMQRAKLYIDFGHHPGKDRLPREAAVAGCCVITNLRGAAAFEADVKIPSKYKIDDRKESYVSEFRKLAISVFQDFDRHSIDFENYRLRIKGERQLFERQVTEIFIR